ncbi:MAG: sigma-54-dependent Fis family transcriptional regulator [Proteobacteria bacterium]|nr:MAG: sigma-54-dependent Fis family transcriptional regulator [Pseudomonadota bacterium]
MSQATVLVVEDEPTLRAALCDTLELAGYPVERAGNGSEALAKLANHEIGMVVSDLQMKPMDGQTLLTKIRSNRPDLPVLMMTAYGTIQSAVEAMQAGAVDYLVKPFEAEALVEKVQQFAAGAAAPSHLLVAEDLRSRELVNLAQRVAASDATVLICGESGTGKEVIARFIHNCSPRGQGPFVAINCAAIPENMLEAVLFGYEKGAFTGAYRSTPGKFEQANGGTLLLDEISEMPLTLQAKLLRVLQEREVERLGGRTLISLDVRVLATTNRRLREEVAAGRFREDLFYRLNVFPLAIPPLRERGADILPLARTLLRRHIPAGEPVPALDGGAEQQLLAYPWPGNVRELENVLQRALILRQSQRIGAEDLHFEGGETVVIAAPAAAEVTAGVLGNDLKSREQRLILDALQAHKGSRKDAAEHLGISARTLRYKLARMRDAGVAMP